MHLLIALGVYALARAAHRSPMAAITAAFLAEIVNWVGQDYLSPQAVAFVLSLLVLTLLLRARESATAGWLSVPVFAVVVVTHQLTPYWLLLIIGALAFGKALRPRWLVFVYFGIALGYLALHLKVAASYGLLSGFDPLGNAESNVAHRRQRGARLHAADGAGAGAAVVGHGRAHRGAPVPRRTGGRRAPSRSRRRDTRCGSRWSWRSPPSACWPGRTTAARRSSGCSSTRCPAACSSSRRCWCSRCCPVPSRTGRARRLAVRWIAVACVVVSAGTSLQGYYGGWFTNVVRQDSLSEMRLLLDTLPHRLADLLDDVRRSRTTDRSVRRVRSRRTVSMTRPWSCCPTSTPRTTPPARSPPARDSSAARRPARCTS